MKEFKYIELDNGLGDNIICASLLMWLSKRFTLFVKVPTIQEKNRITYESFFTGTGITLLKEDMTNMPIVQPVIITQMDLRARCEIKFEFRPAEPKFEKLQSAITRKQGWEDIDISYPNGFFLNYNTTYAIRKKYCPLREQSFKVEQVPIPERPYIFMHLDIQRGFIIQWDGKPRLDMPVIVPDFSEQLSVLAYREAIENAVEVHCIDSSFFNLVNSFRPRGKLFYHRYARPNSPEFAMHPEWTVLQEME